MNKDLCVYVGVCVQMFTCRCTWEARSGCQIPVEPELQAVGSYVMWVLGTELGPSGKAGNTLSHSHFPQPLICDFNRKANNIKRL